MMVNVWIDIDDILEGASDDDIREEALARGILSEIGANETDVEKALTCLRNGDVDEAILILERSVFPKFHSVKQCEDLFRKTRA